MIKKSIKAFGILCTCVLVVFVAVQSLQQHETQFSVFVEPSGDYDSIVKIYVDDVIKFEDDHREMIFFSKKFNIDLSFGFHNVKVYMDENLLREATIFIWAEYEIFINIWPEECENGKCVYIDRLPKLVIEVLNIKTNH